MVGIHEGTARDRLLARRFQDGPPHPLQSPDVSQPLSPNFDGRCRCRRVSRKRERSKGLGRVYGEVGWASESLQYDLEVARNYGSWGVTDVGHNPLWGPCPGMHHKNKPFSPRAPGRKPWSLLDWISSQDEQSSLDQIADQCIKALERLDEKLFDSILREIDSTKENTNKQSMKEVPLTFLLMRE